MVFPEQHEIMAVTKLETDELSTSEVVKPEPEDPDAGQPPNSSLTMRASLRRASSLRNRSLSLFRNKALEDAASRHILMIPIYQYDDNLPSLIFQFLNIKPYLPLKIIAPPPGSSPSTSRRSATARRSAPHTASAQVSTLRLRAGQRARAHARMRARTRRRQGAPLRPRPTPDERRDDRLLPFDQPLAISYHHSGAITTGREHGRVQRVCADAPQGGHVRPPPLVASARQAATAGDPRYYYYYYIYIISYITHILLSRARPALVPSARRAAAAGNPQRDVRRVPYSRCVATFLSTFVLPQCCPDSSTQRGDAVLRRRTRAERRKRLLPRQTAPEAAFLVRLAGARRPCALRWRDSRRRQTGRRRKGPRHRAALCSLPLQRRRRFSSAASPAAYSIL